MPTILSAGVFAFLLQANTFPWVIVIVYFIPFALHVAFIALKFLNLLRSHHKLGWNSWLVLQTCCTLCLKLFLRLRLNKNFTRYIFCCSLLLFEFRIENEFLHRGCELPDVPPHDRAVCACCEELWQGLALYPHGLVHGLDVGHGQADLPLRLAALAIIPPAHLAVVAAPGQKVTVLGVKLARDEVVRGVQVQQRLGGVLLK